MADVSNQDQKAKDLKTATEIAGLLDSNNVAGASDKLRAAYLECEPSSAFNGPDRQLRFSHLLENVSSQDKKGIGKDIVLHYDESRIAGLVTSWDIK